MIQTILKTALLVAILGTFAACGGGVEGEKAKTGDANATKPAATGESYTVSAADSKIDWVGSKKFVGDKHTGYIPLKEGKLTVNNGNISGGTFIWDMNQITVTDLEGDYKGYLEGHLKGSAEGKEDDFFNVAKFPTAKFDITSVAPISGDAAVTHLIKGNLTLKGIAKSIEFKANVKSDANTIKAETPQFVIDRTEWGIVYGASDEASVADEMKDKIVSKDIGIQITLSASK